MKKFGVFLLIILLIILFRNFLFSFFFSYKIIEERKIFKLEKSTSDEKSKNVEEIIHYQLNKTSTLLNFTFDKCDNEPSQLLVSKKANCIGYSAFLAASINNEFQSEGLSNEWIAKHKVGEIYFLGYNIHPFFESKFFKDHDFVVVENKKTNETIALDPALYDYFRIDNIKLK